MPIIDYVPSVNYRNNSSSILCNMLEYRLREVKVLLRRVTPAAWWAKISGSDHNGAREAPLWIIHTPNFKACSTAKAIVVQCSAQCCSANPITLAVQVSISTSPTYKTQKENEHYHDKHFYLRKRKKLMHFKWERTYSNFEVNIFGWKYQVISFDLKVSGSYLQTI